MARLATLKEDIYKVLEGGVTVPQEAAKAFGERLGVLIAAKLSPEREPSRLRMSNLGTKCNRKLWYLVNQPEKAEKLPGNVRLKFLFGHIIEELVLWLVELAGHEVKERQEKRELYGVEGSSDATVDGILVDVKSASSISFTKFQRGLAPESDSFGYLDQLGAYAKSANASNSAFIAVDKQLGHICVDEHKEDLGKDWETLVEGKKRAVSRNDIPDRGFGDVPDGASGNRKLSTECSYCDFKKVCWSDLRVFAYSNGPRYLTVVKREPDVPEFTK